MVAQASLNPIIPGFAPDPSATFVDGWCFVVNSSFHLFPGLPIYASQELSSWKHIGNAINRQSQLSLLKSRTNLGSPAPNTGGRTLPATGGLYAPTIRYHDGTFYIVCTNASRDPSDTTAKKENFILSTKDIWKSMWSDPVYFDFDGIDPSITFDNGKVFIQGSAAPGPATRINNFQIDIETGQRLSPERCIWTGMGGVYPEGPHVFKWDGWFYLIIAEGGTHVSHSVTAARAKDIWGPYQPAPNNPILTAYGTDEYIQHTGHSDVFQDVHGHWWAVCLAVRKSEERYVLSRETFLTPARWQDGWLHMEPVKSDVKNHAGVKLPALTTSTSPEVDYLYVRDAELDRYRFDHGSGTVTLAPSSTDLSSPTLSPTFVAKRQRVLEGRATATVSHFDNLWGEAKVKFGLACYKDEHRLFRIYFDTADSTLVFDIVNKAQNISRTTRLALNGIKALSFSIIYTEMGYTLQYAAEPGSPSMETLATVDTLEMTDPDFVGPIIGLFSTANIEGQQVIFENFLVE
ncbi:unnamed protein product [Clonostachys chloroleuca]|uniref:Beta-xylosidase C-terminal Concanavalin A-like domain-containing protein n=1 Tax=Clonostachys chloroleuca TaxID=1926264 RepID=A0AA35QF73_9HYPO|nr:unnamed protein product [Clonostachys chloroleuca]